MKSYQSSFNEYEYYVTPSDIIEFLYCKRFTYFIKFMGILQHEEKRFKVMKGREIHGKKEIQNREYLRKKFGVTEKKVDVTLVSKDLKIKGRVDEILFFEDNSASPLDYKFAEYEEKIYNTYRTQMVMYSLMIEDIFKVPVNQAYLVYTRSKNVVKEIEITEELKNEVMEYISEYAKVVSGYFPSSTKYKSKCIDCCYRNVCIK